MFDRSQGFIESLSGPDAGGGEPANLILVVRADPIICGHSTEARNLAEAAIARGFRSVHIVSYPLEVLEDSSLR